MCNTHFGGNIYVRSQFSCVRSAHDLCAHAHAHSLEGTLVASGVHWESIVMAGGCGLACSIRVRQCEHQNSVDRS